MASTSTILQSPTVWTDQYGIDTLDAYLDSPKIQNAAQQSLMAGAYEGLVAAGILQGTEAPRFIATFLQPATLYGVNAVIAWIEGTASPETVIKCQIAARQAQFAIDLSNQVAAGEDIVEPPIIVEPPPGGDVDVGIEVPIDEEENPTIDYTDRAVIDRVLQEIIDNAKIPTPRYATPVRVQLPRADEDGTFRFAPGNRGK